MHAPQIFNLPVLSAFAGLVVGCTPPLKHLLIGPDAHLGFLRDCTEVRSCQQCSHAPSHIKSPFFRVQGFSVQSSD